MINFRKPRPGEVSQLAILDPSDAQTFGDAARAILREALQQRPGAPADRLYDELVSRTVRKGLFERHDFDALLRSVAEDPRGDNHWYLLDTADVVDQAESALADAAAATLERFMQATLDQQPDQQGVHYSDLFERYLPVQNKPRRLLADWLPEYFYRTQDGTWRPPADEEERMLKEQLRLDGTLRRAKRFCNALIEGVPPADRDRPENAATAADWLRECRRAALYAQGRALYERGGIDWSALDEIGQVNVEEDYALCARRTR